MMEEPPETKICEYKKVVSRLDKAIEDEANDFVYALCECWADQGVIAVQKIWDTIVTTHDASIAWSTNYDITLGYEINSNISFPAQLAQLSPSGEYFGYYTDQFVFYRSKVDTRTRRTGQKLHISLDQSHHLIGQTIDQVIAILTKADLTFKVWKDYRTPIATLASRQAGKQIT